MRGSLWAPFREGNRSEYLAQYFLSALGVSASVPRAEDIGIDFYCALAQQSGDRLTFHSPFAVQVGSFGTKDFRYGGYSKKGVWQKEQLIGCSRRNCRYFCPPLIKTHSRSGSIRRALSGLSDTRLETYPRFI